MHKYYYRCIRCPHFQQELTDNIGSNKSSLLLDEGNDISIIQVLGVSMIYFSHASNKVESTYLGLVELEKCDASSIENIVSS